MYPESEYSYNYKPVQQRRSKRGPIVVIILLALAAIIVIISLALRGMAPADDANIADPGYKLNASSLVLNQNFGALQGNNLFAYNGLAFYRVDLGDSSKVTVLRSGVKLPKPANVIWAGSTGALMTFDTSFLGTEVSRQVGEVPTEEEEEYAWYMDFASGSLRLVSHLPFMPGAAVYSASENGFYYVTAPAKRAPTEERPLYFYNIQTNQNQLVVKDLGVTDISGMSKCSAGQRLCFIARDLKDTASEKLYALDQNFGKSVAFDSNGRMFATNNPDLYVFAGTTEQGQITQTNPQAGEEQEDSDSAPVQAQLYNAATKATAELGFEIAPTGVHVHFTSDTEFYAFDSDYNLGDQNSENPADFRPAYRAGVVEGSKARSKLFALQYQDGKDFTGNVIAVSHGSEATFVTDATGQQLLFGSTQANLTAQNQQGTEQAVKSCIASGALESRYVDTTRTFQVDFSDDENFRSNLVKFSNCMVQKGSSVFIGYNYQFGGRDPFNGRLTFN